MRSINGFNSDALQGSFAQGQPITASALNKLATAADAARTMMSNDVTFFANTDGVSYGLPQQTVEAIAVSDHPFKLNVYWNEEANMFFATVTAGTVNNIVPVIWGGGPTDDLLNVVPKPEMGLATVQVPPGFFNAYVRCGPDPTNAYVFPTSNRDQAGYPQVYFSQDEMTDTDDFTYIKIADCQVDVATKTVQSVIQYVTGSLWASRIKVGTLTAKYYYARV